MTTVGIVVVKRLSTFTQFTQKPAHFGEETINKCVYFAYFAGFNYLAPVVVVVSAATCLLFTVYL